MKPTVGRIVHYQHPGATTPTAALVVNVEDKPGYVRLRCFPPDGGLGYSVLAGYSETPRNGCWSWPPREG
ncbi:hypothetical protein [Nocardia phage NBR1]|uniref:hypothetical protein n=1 Tax=Nocardia phage NBR1 TaxID=1109711 RepID=UPI00023EED94|nr:hypothetical protein NoPhNBR1_gp02 [Nocardia phage NBR1]AEV52215.1 hypothetical protein [Nocardia phage NBR1]